MAGFILYFTGSNVESYDILPPNLQKFFKEGAMTWEKSC